MRFSDPLASSSLKLSISAILLSLGALISQGEEIAVEGDASKEKEPTAEEKAEAKKSSEESELGEVVIVASRIGKPWIATNGSVSSIRSEDLVRDGAHDAGSVVKYDPTVSAPYDFSTADALVPYLGSGYTGYNIRGAEGNQISLQVDGIRMPPQYVATSFDMGRVGGSGGMGRDYFDPAMFDLIEIYKGGSSSLYGSDAMGGVISMRTFDADSLLKGNTFGGLVRAQYFSVNDMYAGQLGVAMEKSGFKAMLLYGIREGHETENQATSTATLPNPVDFTSHSGLAKVSYDAGDHRFHLALESFARDTFINNYSAARGTLDDFVHNQQNMERERISLRWESNSDKLWLFDRMEAGLYYQQSLNSSRMNGAGKDVTTVINHPILGPITSVILGQRRLDLIDYETDIVGFNHQAVKEFKTGGYSHELLAGVDISMEGTSQSFDRLLWVPGQSSTPSNQTGVAPADTWRIGFYVQDEITLSPHWSILPGLRADYHLIRPDLSDDYLNGRFGGMLQSGRILSPPGDYDNLSFSPRFDIAFKPDENSRIYSTYALGIRNPTAEELTMVFDHPNSGGNPAGSVTLPNPDLEEELSHSFEIGYKTDHPGGRFHAAAFYTFYKNYIEWGRFTGEQDQNGRDINMTSNRGESYIYGVELSGNLDLGNWFSSLNGWSIGGASGIAIGRNKTDDTWLNSVEPWKSTLYLGYDDPGGRFGARLTGMYVDRVRHTDYSTPELGGTGNFEPPAYFLLDATGYWKPTDTLTISAGANNILDETYWSWASGRRVSAAYQSRDRSTAAGANFYLSITQTF